jgi:U3 small nucleolar RNA-associated protein 11
MSSAAQWRNAIPRRMYRERPQLHSREHLGILEKKRDYKRRAKDYHQKENVISNYFTNRSSLLLILYRETE